MRRILVPDLSPGVLTMLITPITMAYVFLVLVFFVRKAYGLKKKGYTGASAGFIVTGTVIVSLAASLALVLLTDGNLLPRSFGAWAGIELVAGPPVFVFLLCSLLPQRRSAARGPRPSKYLTSRYAALLEKSSVGIGAVLLASAVLAWWIIPHADFRLAFRLFKMSFLLFGVRPTFRYLRNLDRKSTVPQETQDGDPLPEILYIREFWQEVDYFIWGPKEKIAPYIARPVGMNDPYMIGATFGQYLSPAFLRHIGRLEALGNPKDRRPPEGPTPFYCIEDTTPGAAPEPEPEWHRIFRKKARAAAVIVMEVGHSDNLRWELDEIVREQWYAKLFIICPPRPLSRNLVFLWAFAGVRWSRHINRPAWPDFVQWMADRYLYLSPEPPGPGTILGFDAERHGVVIAVGAQEPDEFVTPIQGRVLGRFSAGQ